MTDTVIHVYVHLDQPADQVSVTVNLGADSQALAELKDIIMTLPTKDEVLAALDGVRATLTELSSDVARLVAEFNTAVANNDLTAVAAAAAELGTIATAIDAAVEAASPQPVAEPPVV